MFKHFWCNHGNDAYSPSGGCDQCLSDSVWRFGSCRQKLPTSRIHECTLLIEICITRFLLISGTMLTFFCVFARQTSLPWKLGLICCNCCSFFLINHSHYHICLKENWRLQKEFFELTVPMGTTWLWTSVSREGGLCPWEGGGCIKQ